jgi:hypothetical protein
MYAITNSVSASTVSGWIRTLLAARYGDDDPPAEIMALLDNVDRLRMERNTLVHGLWSPHVPGAAEVQTIRWNRREVVKGEIVTASDLDHLVREIDEVADMLADLGRRYGFPVMPKDT